MHFILNQFGFLLYERFRFLGSAALGSIVSMAVVRIMVRVHLVTIKTLESF